MPHTLRSFESTPNPHALKCTVSPAPTPLEGMQRRSYASANEAEAAGDTFALACFAVEGVERVMVLGDFVTLTKGAGEQWSRLKPRVKRAIEGLA